MPPPWTASRSLQRHSQRESFANKVLAHDNVQREGCSLKVSSQIHIDTVLLPFRKGYPLWPTVAPAPATCGGKKRAATDDITTNADRPWNWGTSTRRSKPGILELCQSMGKVMGVLPSTEKSNALCVYFQM